jgi:hypothetical protein
MQDEPVVEPVVAEPVAPVAEPTATPTATPDTANWYDGIPDVSDKDKESKSLNDYVKSTNSLRGLIDRKGIIPPQEGATPEQMAEFKQAVAQHLGEDAFKDEAPAPDAYEVQALIDNAALTDDRRSGILEKFNSMSLSNEQANQVMELFGEQMELDHAMIETFNAESRKSSEQLYKEQWGDDFADRLAGADSIAEKNPDLLAKLEKVGMSGDPDIIRLFDEVARATSEDAPENSEARRTDAASEHKEYINSAEYKEMTGPRTKYSAGMPEYDAVIAKARALLQRSLK